MICGTCGESKDDSEFTKVNISRDKQKGLCKECKKKRDAEYRQKKNKQDARLKYFKLAPDILKRTHARIGVLKLNLITNRQDSKEYVMSKGLQAILDELQEPYELCEAKSINEYEYVLISLTSVMDVENLIYTFEKFAPENIKAQIIVGGFGVCNIKLITRYIDIAIFGRAEGQINQIIYGKEYANVWRKKLDPHVDNKYEVRQAQYLLPGECSIGCRNKCKYCQYTFVRKQIIKGEKYNPGMATQETDWHGLEIDKAGRYNSAWDGFSEQTRLRVNKNIKDIDIVKKIHEIESKGIDKTIAIKLFNIVGYPWETKESVLSDIENVKHLLQSIDIKTRIVCAFLCTPFGAEPLTPMQYDKVDIYTDWHDALNGKKICESDSIKAYIIPSVSGSFTLLKRMMIHRFEADDLELFKSIVFNKKLRNMADKYRVPWLIQNNYIDPVIAGEIDKAAFDYLYVP